MATLKKYFKEKRTDLNPIGFLGERTKWRKHIQRACRVMFDDRYELNKSSGLGLDYKINELNECTAIIRALKKNDSEFLNTYIGITKDLLKSANIDAINPDTLQLKPLNTKKYYLGD